MMRFRALAMGICVTILAVGKPAQADFICRFDRECAEQDGCRDGFFVAEFVEGDAAGFATSLGSMELAAREETAFFAFGSTTAADMILTRPADGMTRASIHLCEGGAVTFFGTCKGMT